MISANFSELVNTSFTGNFLASIFDIIAFGFGLSPSYDRNHIDIMSKCFSQFFM